MSQQIENPWAWWQAALAGKIGPIHDGEPEQGYYRVRDGKGGPWLPVAIWKDASGAWLCKRGTSKARAEDVWTWACRNPISHETYTAVVAGGAWPDEVGPAETRGIGDNLPTDPVERFKLTLDIEREQIEAFLKAPIADEDSAVKAGRWSGKMRDIAKEIDDKRVELKKPHDDAAKAVQQTFKPMVDAADKLASNLKDHVTPWIMEKRRKADAEAAEALRIKREAEQKAADELGVAPPPEPTRAQARAPSKVVTGGVTVRTVKVVQIDDLVKAASHIAAFKTPNAGLVEAVRKAVDPLLRAGYEVPGAKLVEQSSVS
jgi:hypothetical protein